MKTAKDRKDAARAAAAAMNAANVAKAACEERAAKRNSAPAPAPTKPIMTPAQADATRAREAARREPTTADRAAVQTGSFDTVLTITFHNNSTGCTHTWVCADDSAYKHSLGQLQNDKHCDIICNGVSLVKR